MTHFEIHTEIPTTLFDQKDIIPKHALIGFVPTDDDNSIVSPISSSDTCSFSSRRSSYSSFASSSFNSSPGSLIRHSKSLQLDSSDKATLYPTKKSAYDRIEFLEEQLRVQRQLNESILKKKSLKDGKGESGNTEVLSPMIIHKLQEIKQLVADYHIEFSQNKDHAKAFSIQNEVSFSTQIIENWIQRVTQLDISPTKQDLKNVMIPLLHAAEIERNRNARLVEALSRLSQQKHTVSKTARKLNSRVMSLERETNQLKQKLTNIKQQHKEESTEMELVIEDMRKEMESMIEELDQAKQQKDRLEEKLELLEKDLMDGLPEDRLHALQRESETRLEQLKLDNQEQVDRLNQALQERNKIISTHTQQVEALKQEKDQLRSRLVQAERSAAEFDLLIAVERKKNEQPSGSDKELEEALKRTLAERDAEIAKTNQELEKTKKQIDRVQQFNEKQIQREVDARLEELETQLRLAHKKDTDTYKLQISREVRELSGQLVEFEEELQALERQHLQDQQSIENAKHSQFSVEETMRIEKNNWERKEHELKMDITKAEQRIISLEKEVLLLYGKNLDMAMHLGELEV
ncbi:hypothetical protein BD560DRAFT_448917 [Blakeslea trispora]|nr:hypothetical protein BD560DRAFT_448917 [Blakeslea trispora]